MKIISYTFVFILAIFFPISNSLAQYGCTPITTCNSDECSKADCDNGIIVKKCSDGCGNYWDEPCGYSPCPTPIPITKIKGDLKEDLSITAQNCSNNIDVGSNNLNISLSVYNSNPNNNVEIYGCANTNTQYVCSIYFNNQKPFSYQREINLNPQIKLEAPNYTDYSIYWHDNNADCFSRNNFINITAGTQSVEKNLFLTLEKNWFKTKNTSFFNFIPSQRTNIIPQNIINYDEDDDSTKRYLILNESGTVHSKNRFILDYNNNIVSNNNWRINNYSFNRSINSILDLSDYILSKKLAIKVNSLSDLPENFSENIIYINNNITLTSSELALLNQKNLLLFINGTLNFDIPDGNFAPSKSTIIFAQRINFYKNSNTPDDLGIIKYAKGIFVTDYFDSGKSSVQGLKVNGNIISLKSNIDFNKRKWETNQKPSLFVTFDSKAYLDLISILSFYNYQWQEY